MMKIGRVAAIDEFGAHKIIDERLRETEPNEFAYQALIAVMLSAQTKDEVTADAMLNLRNHGLSI